MSDHTMCPGCHQLRYWTDFDARCSQCRQPTPPSGEEMESSPPPKTWAELMDLGIKVQRLEDRLAALEPGPPSPQSSRSPLSDGKALFQPAPGTLVMHCASSPASLVGMLPPSAMVTTVFFRLTPSTPGESEGT